MVFDRLRQTGVNALSDERSEESKDSETVYSFGAFRQRRIRHSLIRADGWQATISIQNEINERSEFPFPNFEHLNVIDLER